MTKDEVIETKAAWGKTFVEIVDPTKENHVFRAYFEQPQRTWVGLTVEEIEAIGKPAAEKDGSIQAWGLFAIAIENKLKEQNSV
jgi:hypothetical protein